MMTATTEAVEETEYVRVRDVIEAVRARWDSFRLRVYPCIPLVDGQLVSWVDGDRLLELPVTMEPGWRDRLVPGSHILMVGGPGNFGFVDFFFSTPAEDRAWRRKRERCWAQMDRECPAFDSESGEPATELLVRLADAALASDDEDTVRDAFGDLDLDRATEGERVYLADVLTRWSSGELHEHRPPQLQRVLDGIASRERVSVVER